MDALVPAILAAVLVAVLAGCAGPQRMEATEPPTLEAPPPAQPWGEETQLSHGNNADADIAASGNLVHIVFGKDPLWYRRSTDAGISFSGPMVLAARGAVHETDAIESDGANVFVLYLTDFRYSPDWCCQRELGDLYVLRSTDSGASWEHAVRLTRGGGAFRQSIAISDGAVHVVWSDFRAGVWEIYYRSSLDGGATWTPERRLIRAAREESNRPQIAAQGDVVHVVWTDNGDGNDRCYTMPHCGETYYIRSADRGASWSAPVRLTHSPPVHPLASLRPDVAAFSDGSVAATFDLDPAFGSSGIQTVMRSPDAGETWLPALQLVPGAIPEQTHPAIAALGLEGVVAWFDRRDSANDEIYSAFSSDGGRSWGGEEQVSRAQGESTTPHAALTDRFAHIAWLDGRAGGSEVFYRRRTLGARTP